MQHVHRALPQGSRQHEVAIAAGRQVAEHRALARLLAARQLRGGQYVLAGGQHLHHRGMHRSWPAAASDQQVGIQGQRRGKLHAAAAGGLLPQPAKRGGVVGSGTWRSRGSIAGYAGIAGDQQVPWGASSCEQGARRVRHRCCHEQHPRR